MPAASFQVMPGTRHEPLKGVSYAFGIAVQNPTDQSTQEDILGRHQLHAMRFKQEAHGSSPLPSSDCYYEQ